MKRILPFILLLASYGASAAPVITSINGTTGQGQTVSINVTGQGTKSPAAPWIWCDFEDGTLNPSSLGQKTTWDSISGFNFTSTEGFGGTKGAKGTPNGFPWTFMTSDSWSNDGQKNYIFRREKKNFVITDASQNWKIYRCWYTTGGYPNIYVAANNGRCYVENIGVESGFWTSLSGFNTGNTNWNAEEIIWQASTINNKDGTLLYRVDGQDKASGTIETRSSAAPNIMAVNYVFHDEPANTSTWSPAWSTSNNSWADEIYVDKVWQRVMIGDASTFSACRHFGFVIPTAWSTTAITGKVSCTDFTNGQTAYVYVFDNTNTPSAGFAITINGASSLSSPSISSLTTTSGPCSGGTSTTILGTGFVNGCTVSIGTTTVTPTFNSINSLTILTPTGPAGAVTVTVTNPDGGTGSLSSGFTYLASPSITSLGTTSGPASGGISVTLTVTGARTGATVKFGTMSATGVTVNSDTSVSCTAPANGPGVVSVTLTDSDGQFTTKANAFSYVAAPNVTSVSPGTGIRTGNVTLTLVGSGFVSSSIVKIGTTTATSTTYINPTILNALTPSVPAGTYSLSITNTDGQTTTLSNSYVATDPPTPAPALPAAFPWVLAH